MIIVEVGDRFVPCKLSDPLIKVFTGEARCISRGFLRKPDPFTQKLCASRVKVRPDVIGLGAMMFMTQS